MRLLAPLAVVAIVAVLPAASPLDRAVDIPVKEWSQLAAGRTLIYRIDGKLWAMEHYTAGTNRVQLQLYDGTCMDGTWDYAAPLYCFHWAEQGTSCFRHTRVGDEVVIIEARDGEATPVTQSMTAVTDVPLSCGTPFTS